MVFLLSVMNVVAKRGKKTGINLQYVKWAR